MRLGLHSLKWFSPKSFKSLPSEPFSSAEQSAAVASAGHHNVRRTWKKFEVFTARMAPPPTGVFWSMAAEHFCFDGCGRQLSVLKMFFSDDGGHMKRIKTQNCISTYSFFHLNTF